jgi:thiamine biosynthesis protein ThiS
MTNPGCLLANRLRLDPLNLIRLIPARGSVSVHRFTSPGKKKERTMQIILNGEPHPLEGDYTLLALLENLDVEKEHTALMLNGAVIPATDWHEHPLKEADEVEIMVFVGGG